jgi:Transposase DDE domain
MGRVDADQGTRDGLGITGVVPCESTFRRTLQNLDADALDDAAGTWAQQRTAPAPGARRVIAVDGKTLRGSGARGEPARHLLAALDHARGVVLGQVDVQVTTNEIPMFAALLDRIDLAGTVVAADALHAQRAQPGTWPASTAHITCSRSRATSLACTPSSPPCPGARFRSPTTPARKATAAPGGAP